jgi:hypothetical protein
MEKGPAVYDVFGVRQRCRENFNVVSGPDLAGRLVRGVADLLGIGAETSKQRVVSMPEKGREAE